ncbi:Cation/H(+) antiporter 24 [Sesamum angolense]|uniref:Cation/H(+) antiporter 24 n=1 Tax=Sesamum angolense TaxID=2727404 RepID=A0AAE1X9I4_9LAMI|nr:Cation/H(+) antiporter 24 [Sesamum angolense]
MATKENFVICRGIANDHAFGIFYGQNPLKYSFPLLLLELSSIIIISHVVRFLLKPLRQPKGGIILGPSVLSRNKKFHSYMFPDNADYVIKNLGVMGFMYFLFMAGVKMDLTLVRRVDKKHWYIALVGVLVPLIGSLSIAFMVRKSLDKELAKASSIWGVTSSLAITAFPVLYSIVKELNLVSSEIGRMALSSAVIGDVIGITGVIIFEATKQGEHRPIAALFYLISLAVFMASIMGGVRQAMLWIVRTTPEGKPVDQIYVIVILLSVMVSGFFADMFGLAIANGPLWLGLVVPDGPPLGAILVEKSETIAMVFLMPFSYMYVGMITDLYSLIDDWKPLFYMVLAGYTIKMAATLIVARFLDLTIRDSLTLSLIMSLRGEVELLLFLHWMDFQMIRQEHFTILVLLTAAVTALFTPLISILYDPTRPYMVNRRRNIQHTPPNTELHIVACIHEEENLYGLMKLLELSNPTVDSPFSVYTLHLIELVGRSNPVFIDHEIEEKKDNQSHISSIHNALKIFQETRAEFIKIHPFTAMTIRRSMYQNICELALCKHACLIIVPFHKKMTDNHARTRRIKQVFQSVSSNVLAHAPCTVGILVDRSPYPNIVNGVLRSSMHHLVVLFLGGADAREALCYADRMAGSPAISLTVIRFLPNRDDDDTEMEKKLDDGLLTWFWVKNEGNTRVVYREVVVKNGEETIAAIQAINGDCCDLWIMGRKQGINPVLLQGLSNRSEKSELGVIGDYIASMDFGSRGSILVVQQQILRGQGPASAFSWCKKWQ